MSSTCCVDYAYILTPLTCSVVLNGLKDNVTLASLPTSATWHFATKDIGILCLDGEPVAVNVYGAVRSASLCGFRARGTLAMTVSPWSQRDSDHARRIFPSTAPGSSLFILV